MENYSITIKEELKNLQRRNEIMGYEYNRDSSLPTEISIWTKIKNFLFQEITITMTPKQEKVLQEVHDFWCQEITGKKVHDFLFQEIRITDNITL